MVKSEAMEASTYLGIKEIVIKIKKHGILPFNYQELLGSSYFWAR